MKKYYVVFDLENSCYIKDFDCIDDMRVTTLVMDAWAFYSNSDAKQAILDYGIGVWTIIKIYK